VTRILGWIDATVRWFTLPLVGEGVGIFVAIVVLLVSIALTDLSFGIVFSLLVVVGLVLGVPVVTAYIGTLEARERYAREQQDRSDSTDDSGTEDAA